MLPFELLYRDIKLKEVSNENIKILKINCWILPLYPMLKLKVVELGQILVVMKLKP